MKYEFPVTVKVIVGVIILAILAIATVYVVQYREEVKYKKVIIHYKDPKLTVPETQESLDKIEQYTQKLGGALSIEEQFNSYTQIGHESMRIGKYDEAKGAYQKAATLMPDNVNAWRNLYLLSDVMKDYVFEKEVLLKLIEINSTDKARYETLINQIPKL